MKKGEVLVYLHDENGKLVKTTLKNALYVPSYPQNIFSVQAATGDGAKVSFEQNHAKLQWKDGHNFHIKKSGRLYYLYSCVEDKDEKKVKPKRSLNSEVWHKIMGHCNLNDLMKTETIVEGMKIGERLKFECETCVMGKQARTYNRNPDDRATQPMERVHSDLSGAVEPASVEGHRYAMIFIDDYSDAKFVYFLKKKNDAVFALEKFLADTSTTGT